MLKQAEGIASWESQATVQSLQLQVQAQMEFDGTIEFLLRIRASRATPLNDVSLEIPLSREISRYMMGMGVKGGFRPREYRWKWDQKKNQDSAWVGDVNAGLQFTLKADNYDRPLNTNFYLLKPLNLPPSWHNYYIEGLNWLVKNVGIDGLYIDDVAFDRTTMKRVRRVLDSTRPGALIDLHSANQFNVRDGFANSANLYLEHFPYLNRLWFGEYFDYNAITNSDQLTLVARNKR